MDKIVIVGLGLIGGSLARALKKRTDAQVTAQDLNPAVIRGALAAKAIDREAGAEDLAEADIVFLCLYPQAAIDFVQSHGHELKRNCIVTDVCGIKGEICTHIPALARWYGFCFIGGHPMAGRERSGFLAGSEDLFDGASYILVPCGAPAESVERLKALVMRLGFASTLETTAERHDEMIAFTSQVPHVLASAYVASPRCLQHKGFSAGSYRDVSRVANINEVMWAELFVDNAEPLTAELDLLLWNLTQLRNAVARKDNAELRSLLRRGRDIKEGLGE